ncbi:MAG: hypothetical protein MZV64_51180 [Ignavibacteriales bacterium]|nr:hypothetical protein [Ignavibacteriales bacterium]
MEYRIETIGVAPVGCSVFAYHYMNIDMQEAAHGRASAVATGIKEFYLINMFSHIRVMAILPQSVLQKQFILSTAEKTF